ncbi:hypothetical protein AQUCO_00400016v1 [Aquilegia coerulea]|uniref:Transmembrane protein n=1 Tax=Aquilegia coerulea TaxID=218851 RepID=A0A2G5ET02_AQUCA|nr:hypothetical protein AQUCO_00400016v1 [Aquilegia coerulea]
MAKNFSELHSVTDILREVCKLPRRNKKIYFFIFLSTSILHFLLILAIIYSLASVFNDISITSTDPTSLDDPKQLFKFILIEVVIILLMSAILFYTMMTTVYVSAMSYLERDLKLKDLFKKIKKIWIRPMVTGFYSTLISTGFLVLVVPLFLLVILMKGSLVVIMFGIVLVPLVIYLNMYLALVWMLSIVTSVLEDCYGLQAIGKGAQLLKGRKVVGFVLNFVLMILFGVSVLLSIMNMNIQSVTVKLLISLCGMNFAILVKILSMMIYTVFYFDCKQSHGEDVVVEENMGYYTKVSTFPLVDSALP